MYLLGQTNTELITELENKINSSWTVKIDTTVSDSFSNSSLLNSGVFEGMVLLSNRNNNVIKFLLFYSENDSVFTNEIGNYLDHASCGPPQKYQPASYYFKFEKYYLFLPLYPCWSPGYSTENKKQILRLYGKAKRRRNKFGQNRKNKNGW